eukprot:2664595-Pleurochrysis_carterae.AAC.1
MRRHKCVRPSHGAQFFYTAVGVEDTAIIQQLEPVESCRVISNVRNFAPQNVVAKGSSCTLS